MSVNTQVLFDRPQREIATLLRDRLAKCRKVRIVSGFATIDGFEAIFPSLRASNGKLQDLVVGAATYKAFELFDELLGSGVPASRLRVHLGHTRLSGARAAHPFHRYHPMLHSKVYMMDMGSGNSAVFIGSHNLTAFALHGLNGEAAVLLEGPSIAPEMQAASAHIDECVRQAVEYEPAMKDAYTWWTVQSLEGLRDKANDMPREGEGERTIVILGVRADEPLPKKDDIVYFEIPEGLGQVGSLNAEVHIYVFPKRPESPLVGLRTLQSATRSYWCTTLGIEKEQGGVELRADWRVVSDTDPRLEPAVKPFRPQAAPGMRQIRVKVHNEVRGQFEYLFPEPKRTWKPELSGEERVELPHADIERLKPLGLIPPMDRPWSLVRGLIPDQAEKLSRFQEAVQAASPSAGRFILFSLRRREKK